MKNNNQPVAGFNGQKKPVSQKSSFTFEEELLRQLKRMEEIPFVITETRKNEVKEMLKSLLGKAQDVPVLVVEKEEDVFPLLSTYTQIFSKHASFRPTLPISPTTVGVTGLLEAPNQETYQEIFDDASKSLESLKYSLTQRGVLPVIGGFGQYIQARATSLLDQHFLLGRYPVVFVLEQEYLTEFQKEMAFFNQQIGGLKTGASPFYRPSFARCRLIPIAPMTHQEKSLYLSTQIKNLMQIEHQLIKKEALSVFVETVLARVQGKDIFTQAFNLLDSVVAEASFENKAIDSKLVLSVLNKELPIHDVAAQMKLLSDIDDRLKAQIFGQDEAIDAAYSFILGSYDDVTRQKPLVMGFFGPSGVGKTALGEEISVAINGSQASVINMSEYSSEFKASQLTGSSKGYVNSDEEGVLARIIKENPRAVLILDEFEKAHPSVRQLFLGLFDKGTIRDNKLGDLDYSKATIILTSNAGVVSTSSIGFGTQETRFVADMGAIKASFPPELLGRMDAKIMFQPLEVDTLAQIVDKFMAEFKPRFDQMGVEVTLSSQARLDFAKQGLDPQMGARPLRNLLRQHVKAPVEIGILKKRITIGSHITVQSVGCDDALLIQKAPRVLKRGKGKETRGRID